MIRIYQFLCLSLIFGISYGLKVPKVKLSDGNEMPVVGIGAFLLTSEQMDTTITAALENNYRHIDTAFVYFNENDIGKGLKKWFASGGRREDIFITTKLPPEAGRPSDVAKACELSLSRLGLDYIDMYLIHTPFSVLPTTDFGTRRYENGSIAYDVTTNHVEIWKEMEKLVRSGKVKSIGLSNFNKTQILKIWEKAEIKPSNLQVETNVYIQQDELVELSRKLGMVMTGYSPIGSGGVTHVRKRDTTSLPPLLQHPVVTKIAKKYNKTPAQVLLRFNLQRGLVVIPKSSNPKRIKENIDIFDFILRKKDMKQLRSLDQHGKYRKFDLQSYYPGCQYHPEYPFSDRIPK